jgi:hypothetical protein
VFEEMTFAMKKGGLAIFAARFSYMGNFWYNDILNDMVAQNRWQLVKEEEFFKYDKLLESVGRFAKTPCKVFAYRNLCEEINSWKKRKATNVAFSAFNKDPEA